MRITLPTHIQHGSSTGSLSGIPSFALDLAGPGHPSPPDLRTPEHYLLALGASHPDGYIWKRAKVPSMTYISEFVRWAPIEFPSNSDGERTPEAQKMIIGLY